ncbi:MAG: hypothetical protein COC01_04715 [Bacteroidetes bacterium]|nr:hypothetical protein [Bacteroidia bacterium]PCH67971.1 MAG: hypothetical protein COC01_04715 [Bacteroidota bacterium]
MKFKRQINFYHFVGIASGLYFLGRSIFATSFKGVFNEMTSFLFGIFILTSVVYVYVTPYLKIDKGLLKKYFNIFRNEKIELSKMTKYEQLDENTIRIYEDPEYWIDIKLKEIEKTQRQKFMTWLDNEIKKRAIT